VEKRKIRRSVVQQISEAFADVPYPGDHPLVCEPVWSEGEVTNAFRGRDWHDVDVVTLWTNREALSFFTPQALRFYLPAFMIASLLHPKQADVLPNEVCYTLNPPKTDDIANFKVRMAVFNGDQKRAIQAFLMFARDYLGIAEARHALHRFWLR